MKLLEKADIFSPAFELKDGGLVIKPDVAFDKTIINPFVVLPELTPGRDYFIQEFEGALHATDATLQGALGGFHVSLGGGILAPSIYDPLFRPKSRDPRGMRLQADGFSDIYLLNKDHKNGTSRAGQEILVDVSWWDACEILAAQDKQLLSTPEFAEMARGVTANKSAGKQPTITEHVEGLRSDGGNEQATGTVYTWLRDIDSDKYALLGGGYWWTVVSGPRRLDDDFASNSSDFIGARGRCDLLILA